ncbi:MAG: hypothetical protein PHE54_03280 [Bacilli bacterium]|nr:hypothetical protein [Bacilli bacterium]
MNKSTIASFIGGFFVITGRSEITCDEIVKLMGKLFKTFPEQRIIDGPLGTLESFIENDGVVVKLKPGFSLSTILAYPLFPQKEDTIETMLFYGISADLYNQLYSIIEDKKIDVRKSPSPYEEKLEELCTRGDRNKGDASRGIKVFYL